MAKRSYLGQAIQYPHKVTVGGSIALISDKDLIRQSLTVIFNTPLGTEFFREHLGSNHRILMFEPNNTILRALMDYYVVDAIARGEQRIRVMDIKYNQDPKTPKMLSVKIYYQIKQSSEIDSYIFPFYRTLNI